MSMTLGRVGSDLTLSEPDEWQERSDGTIDVGGWLTNADADDAGHLRDQLLGLIGSPDEPVVPLTISHDDTRNGWYRVLDGGVEHVLGATEIRGDRRWGARVLRMPWWDQPRYELNRDGGVVTNSSSITTSTYTSFIALPDSAEAVDSGTDTGTLTRGARTSETGALAFITGSGTGAALYNTVVSADVPLADFYDGAPTIKVDPGSGTLRTVVGRQVRKANCADWSMDNGLVKVSWNSTTKGLTLSVYTGATWHTITPLFRLTDDSSYTLVGENPISWAVLRNDPTMVAVRLVLDYGTGTSRILWDLGLRRGDRNIISVVKSRSSKSWGIRLSADEGATAVTGGIRATLDDTNGHRWVMCSPKAATYDTTNGRFYITTPTQVAPFGIGVELNGSASAGQNTAQNVAYQYYAQPFETQSIAGV